MYPYDLNLGQQSDNLIQNRLSQMLSPTPQLVERHVTKVNGRAGADSYQMAPNSDDILLDMNEPLIYFVQTDGAGYKSVTPYDISLHKEVKAEDQFKSLEERISKLEEAVANGKSNYRPANERGSNTPAKQCNGHNNAGDRSNDQG